MRVLISAAEISADHHGAKLLAALRQSAPAGENVEAFGVAGERMRAEGCEALVRTEDLRAMGTWEVLGKVPAYRRALAQLKAAAEARRPDVLVCLDSPDFHFRLARAVSARLPKVYYIPPKVWIWRRRRVRELRALFSRILCILPFEVGAYRAGAGGEAVYVGNPLLDELPRAETRESSRRQLGIDASARVLLVMPGSRPGELSRHLPLVGRAIRLFRDAAGGDWRILVPVSSQSDRALVETAARGWDARVSVGDAHLCMRAADLGLIKSGTATLEAALLGCPHVLFYKPSWITGFLFHYLVGHRKAVGLVNWIAGMESPPYLVPEVVTGEATPERLAESLLTLWSDGATAMREGFARVARALETGESPSLRAAREIWRVRDSSRGTSS